jgi:hypothetical protein
MFPRARMYRLDVLAGAHGPARHRARHTKRRIQRQQISNRSIFPADSAQDVLSEETTEDG